MSELASDTTRSERTIADDLKAGRFEITPEFSESAQARETYRAITQASSIDAFVLDASEQARHYFWSNVDGYTWADFPPILPSHSTTLVEVTPPEDVRMPDGEVVPITRLAGIGVGWLGIAHVKRPGIFDAEFGIPRNASQVLTIVIALREDPEKPVRLPVAIARVPINDEGRAMRLDASSTSMAHVSVFGTNQERWRIGQNYLLWLHPIVLRLAESNGYSLVSKENRAASKLFPGFFSDQEEATGQPAISGDPAIRLGSSDRQVEDVQSYLGEPLIVRTVPPYDGPSLFDLFRNQDVVCNPSYTKCGREWQSETHGMVDRLSESGYLDASECCEVLMTKTIGTAIEHGDLPSVAPRYSHVFVEVVSTPQLQIGNRVEEFPGLVAGWGAFIESRPNKQRSLFKTISTGTRLLGAIAVRLPGMNFAVWPYLRFQMTLDAGGRVKESETRFEYFLPAGTATQGDMGRLAYVWTTPLLMRLALENDSSLAW